MITITSNLSKKEAIAPKETQQPVQGSVEIQAPVCWLGGEKSICKHKKG